MVEECVQPHSSQLPGHQPFPELADSVDVGVVETGVGVQKGSVVLPELFDLLLKIGDLKVQTLQLLLLP